MEIAGGNDRQKSIPRVELRTRDTHLKVIREQIVFKAMRVNMNRLISLEARAMVTTVLELQTSINNHLSDVHFDLVSRTKLLMFLPTKLTFPHRNW